VVVGGLLADWSLQGALSIIVALYALAGFVNLFVPKLPIEKPYQNENVWRLVADFFTQLRQLWRLPDARLSLTGTSLFWATGSSLRLMLFAWVPVALLVDNNQLPATLMGLVSIGITVGAGLAAWKLPLHKARLALWGGLALAPLLLLLAFTHQLIVAVGLLIALGVAGGWFVVPLNALLQQRGHQSIGTGRALAVQNVFENTAMFVWVSMYGLLIPYLTINTMMLIFAGLLGMTMVWLKQLKT
jgi:LPLT family lysophospholipid transporter-like MFS transporter